MPGKRLLIIQVAGLGYELLRRNDVLRWQGLDFQPARSVLPAVTCTVQASFRTATMPCAHGMIANGLFHRQLNRPLFWEQSARQVAGRRIWQEFRAAGGRVGMMFWQQSLGEAADLVLSPTPIHKHHGGMIQDCYSLPAGLYEQLCHRIGRGFQLRHYWGPLASAKAGDWIAAATVEVLEDHQIAPDLLLTYLPSLDYNLQRYGPDHGKSRQALRQTLAQLDQMVQAARRRGYDVLVFGDYAIVQSSQAVFPNRALLAGGLMSARSVRGMLYPDLHTSRAFAMVDHEIAHVYVPDAADVPAVRQVLQALPGVAEGLDSSQQVECGLAHANSGELLILAQQDHWFAYPWWTSKHERPDYATHVDIHNKPGFDPCELFFGWPPPSVSQDTSRVRGSHGQVGPGREVAWATTLPIPQVSALVDLAAVVGEWLREGL
jgi:predicted AlkP superfamily pyrophosphatase or phosphodiesterase